jgi:phage terminase large subunit
MNPENEEDPMFQDYILRPPDNAIIRKVNWYDNPWFNDVLAEEKRLDYERDPDNAAWIWGGECRKISDKQVLRGKCETKPFTPRPDVWDGPYQGIDFGFGQDPVCLIRCWIWEGDLYIEYEAYGDHCEIEEHPALFDSIEKAREFVTRADCSRPEMISYLKRNGYGRVQACQKWPGCVEDRITYLKSFHRIYIHPRCPRIEKEGKRWSWKTNKAGDILNVLIPGNDHGWDAVGYALEPHIKGLNKKEQKPVVQPIPIASRWS